MFQNGSQILISVNLILIWPKYEKPGGLFIYLFIFFLNKMWLNWRIYICIVEINWKSS